MLFALPGNGGCLGVSGCAGSNTMGDACFFCEQPNSVANARPPKPIALSLMKCRRGCIRKAACSASRTNRWLCSSCCVIPRPCPSPQVERGNILFVNIILLAHQLYYFIAI